jgi:hypothetical protein
MAPSGQLDATTVSVGVGGVVFQAATVHLNSGQRPVPSSIHALDVAHAWRKASCLPPLLT